MNDLSAAKQAAGDAAAQFVQEGMLVGLGTGSTAECFIKALIRRCQEGLRITAIATSQRSAHLAAEAGIPLVPSDDITTIDLTVDGADEITMQKQMIKGGGGALLREKILAAASKELIITVDETKIVDHLGGFPLAVELVPFAYRSTLERLYALGYQGALRYTPSKQLYLTDNGNYIIDLRFNRPILDPEKEHQRLSIIPGVVETGLFFNFPVKIVIGFRNGLTEVIR